MNKQKFNFRTAIHFGWYTTWKNFLALAAVLLFMTFVNVATESSTKQASLHSLWMYIFITVVSIVIDSTLNMGLIRITLELHDNGRFQAADLFNCIRLIFKYLIGSILYSLLVIIGLVLLVVPGIIWAIKYHFFFYLIVDKKLGPIEALEKSAQITNGAKLDLFFFFIILILINLLGALCLIIGLLVTIPIAMLATAHVYRQLLANSEIEETTACFDPR
jgi:uncharacterized membrane protein